MFIAYLQSGVINEKVRLSNETHHRRLVILLFHMLIPKQLKYQLPRLGAEQNHRFTFPCIVCFDEIEPIEQK